MPWRLFDLSCTTPAGMTLIEHRLTPGDLSLTFRSSDGAFAGVRQIAVARGPGCWTLRQWLWDDQSRRQCARIVRRGKWKTSHSPPPTDASSRGSRTPAPPRLRRRLAVAARQIWSFALARCPSRPPDPRAGIGRVSGEGISFAASAGDNLHRANAIASPRTARDRRRQGCALGAPAPARRGQPPAASGRRSGIDSEAGPATLGTMALSHSVKCNPDLRA